MTTIWDVIDKREAAYKVECASTLERIKGMFEARFPATCSDCGRPHERIDGHDTFDERLGEITCLQDEGGWWRATVKLRMGWDAAGGIQWRELAFKARTSKDLVQAAREHKEPK